MEIIKTITSTLDVGILVVLFVGMDKKDRKTIGLGALIFIALNIAVMWL